MQGSAKLDTDKIEILNRCLATWSLHMNSRSSKLWHCGWNEWSGEVGNAFCRLADARMWVWNKSGHDASVEPQFVPDCLMAIVVMHLSMYSAECLSPAGHRGSSG